MLQIAMFDAANNSRWTAALLTIGLATLLVLLARDLHSGGIPPASAGPAAQSSEQALPLHDISRLFSQTEFAEALLSTNLLDPFYTSHFQPAVAPSPPAVQKINLAYHGYYESTEGNRRAYVKVGDRMTFLKPGESVAANWMIAEITARHLVLTNASGETNQLIFQVPKEVEIP